MSGTEASEAPVVSVRGEATLEAEPELAVVTLSVDAHGPDRRTAVDLLSQRARSVADVVTRFESGIERAETSHLHVYPELENKRSERIKRYVGRTSTTITVHDFTVLSDLLVAASSIDLVSVSGPWWRLRTNSPVYRQARLAAAEDAKSRARDYAEAFGARVERLIEIADLGLNQPITRPMRLHFAAAGPQSVEGAGGPELALEPGHQEVTGQVEARFLLTDPDPAAVVPGGAGAP
jgi:hypothetical protein